MNKELLEKLQYLSAKQSEIEIYERAIRLINFDMETVAPKDAMPGHGELLSEFSEKAFRLSKDEKFVSSFEELYAHLDEMDCPFDKAWIKALHRDYARTKNVTPEKSREWSEVNNEAFISWSEAKAKSDYSIFLPSLKKIKEVALESIEFDEERKPVLYDNLLDLYEPGMTSQELDRVFASCKKRLIPLLAKIQSSSKTIRTDFLSRPVKDEQQKEFAEYLLKFMGFDFSRGAMSLSEHPFTDGLSQNDARVTTHFYPDAFLSSMYSIIHEGGHALFEQNQPKENFEHHISNLKTMGMHESVSRFYENVLGRSEAFIHAVYPKMKEIFPNVLFDVSEKELYDAVNCVTPSLIRTEADEFTYLFHIIIRYELEQEIINGKVKLEELDKVWADRYEAYLGVRPSNDKEGVLQDVHWSSGFGYFPTYALGNFYNSMYIKAMKKDLDVEALLEKGDMLPILNWMKEHVFAKADRLTAKEWIKDITGREFTENDFLDYLEEKYSKIYDL